jgi:hypothetical protein
MTTRLLPPAEWPRLSETLLATIWPTLNPRYAEVIVVEADGAILGSVALLQVLHAECLSLNGSPAVARALWKALRDRVRHAGGLAVWGAAIEEPMQRLLTRHAEPIPGAHFLVRM